MKRFTKWETRRRESPLDVLAALGDLRSVAPAQLVLHPGLLPTLRVDRGDANLDEIPSRENFATLVIQMFIG